jgi:serine/threonine protein kinase
MLDEEDKTIIKPLDKKPVEELEPGAQLGQYKIIRLLGRGGMGEVYEAEHTTLDVRYALKLLPSDLLATTAALERFRREARVMAKLRHPHILHVDDFGETAGRYWLRMELASGLPIGDYRLAIVKQIDHPIVSLQDLAEAKGGKLPQDMLLAILQQIVSGLTYAHQRGLVHRDLKPSNILLTSDSPPSTISHPPYTIAFTAKISDFGLVRLVGAEWLQSRVENSVRLSASLDEQPTLTVPKQGGSSTRSLLGTYEYMSPEQKRGEEADARSDIYALGLMTFRLLTGQREPGFELPSDMDEHLVLAWDDVVKNALQARREKRIADCAALSRLLEAVAAALFQGSEKPAAPVPEVRKIATPAPPPPPPVVQTPDLKSPWTNSLGMEFVPVTGTQALFCKWLTRVQDFEAFVKATGHDATKDMYSLRKGEWKKNGDTWKSPGFAQGLTHPVCGVNWDDAQAFCQWLTEQEWKAGRLKSDQAYRLPQDWEWSVAVGLNEARIGTPQEKIAIIPNVYPWGSEWPPPRGAGNFAGEEAKNADWPSDFGVIAGYNDGYPRTSPVGSFQANRFGLFDMAGNLREWCEDFYDGQSGIRVLRGGCWGGGESLGLLSWGRGGNHPGDRDDFSGFRVVLGSSVP